MTDQQKIYYIALSMHHKVGPITAKNLILYAGGIEALFKMKKKDLLSIPGIGTSFVASFDLETTMKAAETQYQYTQKHNLAVITYMDPKYPRRLNHIEASPIVLYYKGTADLNHHRTVALVGTRKPSDYGRQYCEIIVDGLRPYNTVVVSGLAYGVDAIAHRQAVASDIPTIGIMGHGHDRIYPADNKMLASKMVDQGGGLLSEFPIGTKPDRENFPMRNRIIAALSDVIIVIESKRTGGSIITAEFGNEYNKDVFALPGPVNAELSEGCNKLIKQNKAHLIESAADVAYIMRWEDLDSSKSIQRQLFLDLSDQETMIIDTLRQNKEMAIDAIMHAMQMSPSAVSSLLLEMEFKGLIRSLPGKKYGLS